MSSDNIKWYSADDEHFRLSGFAFRKKGEAFCRFEEGVPLPEAVERLARHTPGGQLAFKTDSPFIRLKFSPASESYLAVNTRITTAGFDLYMGKPGGKQYFCGVTRMKIGEEHFDQCVFDLPEKKMRAFTLHFPLYSGVGELAVGLAEDAVVELPRPWDNDLPVVYYGTSIIHGGCANRPGMMMTNILSRRLNRPFLNFGFAGSGRGEFDVFMQLARVRKCALFVLDYGPNVNADTMKETLGQGIDVIRSRHSTTPILVVGKMHYISEFLETGSLKQRSQEVQRMTRFQREEVRRRRRKGDKNLFFTPGDWGREPDWTEFTVDGVHPTDLGFMFFSKIMEKEIRKYIN